MKLLITTGIYPPDIGGPASYVPKIATACLQAGHVVTVVTLADAPDSVRSEDGCTLVRVNRARSALSRKLHTLHVLRRHCAGQDLIFANGLFEELAILRRTLKAPLVAKFVGDWGWERARNMGLVDVDIDSFQAGRIGVRARTVRALRRWVARKFQDVIVPSRYLADMVQGWYHKRPNIEVIHNGIDLPQDVPTRDPTPSTEPIDLVTVCRLVPWKNVDALIRYTAQTQAVRLTVVGDGPQRRDLEALADELNALPRVSFRGAIDRNATLAAIGHADIFVLNSDYEGLPHVVLEAMALARPVVARTSGGSREVLQHDVTGLLIDDDAGLWAALRRLREEPALSARLVSTAQQVYTDHFTERAMCERTVDYLEDCYRRPVR